MDSTIINVIISLVVGMIVGIIVLRYFFKDSILFKIGLYWVISLLIVMTNTALTSKFRDEYPIYISLPIGIAITVYLIYLTAKTIKGPLANAINNLHILSQGDLKVEVKKTGELQKDELALIENSVFNLSTTLNDVISKVRASSDQLNISSQHLNSSSQLLAQGSSEQASTTEELSSTIEEINSNIRQNAENSKVSVEIAESATIDLTQLIKISEKTAMHYRY